MALTTNEFLEQVYQVDQEAERRGPVDGFKYDGQIQIAVSDTETRTIKYAELIYGANGVIKVTIFLDE